MKIIYSALTVLIILLAACNDPEVAEPARQPLPEGVDQLKRLLATHPADEIKLEIYYALYKSHKKSDLEVAIQFLQKQRALAEDMGDHLTSGKACYNLGKMHRKGGDYIQAVEVYLKSIDYFSKLEEYERIASVLNNLGVVFMETGNYEYAIRFLSKAKEIYVESNDVRRLVLTNLNLGISNFSKVEPDYQAANGHFQLGLQLSQELKEDQDYYLNWIYTQIGTMNHRKGEYDAAVENFLLSLQHIDPSNNVEEQRAIGYANIGETFMDKGDYTEARKWLEKAFDLSTYIEDSKRVVAIYNTMGELTHLEGEVQTAADILEEAITLANKEVINPTLQETLKLIRVSYKELKQVSKARYDNVLELDGAQDALEKEMVDRLNFQALQAALSMKIELNTANKEKNVAIASNSVYINMVIGLVSLALIITILLGYRIKKARDANILKSKELETQKKELDEKTAMLDFLEPLILDAEDCIKRTEQLCKQYNLR